jgi:transposase/transposase-like protein
MPHKSDDLKQTAVQHYLEQSHNYDETSSIFHCPASSLKRWVIRFQQTGQVTRQKREYVSYKVTKQHVQDAMSIIKKQPTISMEELSKQIKEEHKDYSITAQWLGKVLRENNQTRKRTKHKHEPITRFRKPIDIQEEHRTFYSKVARVSLNDIICLDETSVAPFMVKNYSRCRLGKRCVTKTTSNVVFRKYTLLLATSTQGMVGWELYPEGGVDSERMRDFIVQHIHDKHRGKLIIMDNAGAHRKDIVKEAVANSGNTLLYSVPYSPKTNAIEMVFSELKHHLSTGDTRTFEELKKAIHRILTNVIPTDHYRNYIRHAYDQQQIEWKKRKSTRERKPPKYKTA